ncbi:hypothetical protein IWX48DRAFT_75337 [Phyllosticta citricarpa]
MLRSSSTPCPRLLDDIDRSLFANHVGLWNSAGAPTFKQAVCQPQHIPVCVSNTTASPQVSWQRLAGIDLAIKSAKYPSSSEKIQKDLQTPYQPSQSQTTDRLRQAQGKRVRRNMTAETRLSRSGSDTCLVHSILYTEPSSPRVATHLLPEHPGSKLSFMRVHRPEPSAPLIPSFRPSSPRVPRVMHMTSPHPLLFCPPPAYSQLLHQPSQTARPSHIRPGRPLRWGCE